MVVASAVALAEAVPDASLRPAGLHARARRGGRPHARSASCWWRPATSASTRSRSAASSRSAAGSSTSSRRPRSAPRGWSCSATRSSRSAGSRPSPSARSARSTPVELSPGRRALDRAPRAGRAARSRTRSERPDVGRAAADRPLPRRAGPDRRRGRDRRRREEIEAALRDHWEDVDRGDARRGRAPALRRRRGAAGRARGDVDLDGALGRGALVSRPGRPAPPPAASAEAESQLEKELGAGYRVVVSFEHRGEAERARYNLKRLDAQLPGRRRRRRTRASCAFAEAPLSDGFVAPELKLAVIPFRRLVHRRRAAAPAPARGRLATFADLRVGDHVVHEDHGIARFAGFETKTVGGRHPRLPRARVPRRRPRLRAHRPAGEDHPLRRHRRRARRSSRRSAPSAGRGSRRGLAARRASWRASCSTSTPSARRAAATRSRPTASGSSSSSGPSRTARPPTSSRRSRRSRPTWSRSGPMDRLICGDVGYGKTEVALRAAHKAASEGKQVMMLVPTTILAQQHLGTFRERLRDFPIEIEMVSRLRKPAEVRDDPRALRRRQGRHPDRHPPAALARRPRAGPRPAHRRRGAALRGPAEGAPAPAEAQGRRALDVGDADPADAADEPRRAARHLGDRDAARGPAARSAPTSAPTTRSSCGARSSARRSAAARRSSSTTGSTRSTRSPSGCGRCAPGSASPRRTARWTRRELEATMLDFLRGDADCLVATTIIESGLDIPQANTLIVERADQLGLAQAYQIRGRVGRSRERAYAYLLYPSEEALSPRRRPGSRRSPTTPSSAPGSRSRCATSSSAAPATCSATSSPATSRRSASSSTCRCSTRRSRQLRGRGRARAGRRPRVRLDVDVDAYLPADYIPFEAAKIDVHRRVAGAARRRRAARPARRAARPLRPGARAGREPARAPARADRARRRRGPDGRVPRRAALGDAARARRGRGRRGCASGSPRRCTSPAQDPVAAGARRARGAPGRGARPGRGRCARRCAEPVAPPERRRCGGPGPLSLPARDAQPRVSERNRARRKPKRGSWSRDLRRALRRPVRDRRRGRRASATRAFPPARSPWSRTRPTAHHHGGVRRAPCSRRPRDRACPSRPRRPTPSTRRSPTRRCRDLLSRAGSWARPQERGITISDTEIANQLKQITQQQFGGREEVPGVPEAGRLHARAGARPVELQLITDADRRRQVVPKRRRVTETRSRTTTTPTRRSSSSRRPATCARSSTTTRPRRAGQGAAGDGRLPTNWKKVAAKYSTDQATKDSGGLREGVTEGQSEPALDAQIFSAPRASSSARSRARPATT